MLRRGGIGRGIAGAKGNQQDEGGQGGGVRKLHNDSFFFPISPYASNFPTAS